MPEGHLANEGKLITPEPAAGGQPLDPSVLIKGYGALKGRITLPEDIDWTKPIYVQVVASPGNDLDIQSSAA